MVNGVWRNDICKCLQKINCEISWNLDEKWSQVYRKVPRYSWWSPLHLLHVHRLFTISGIIAHFVLQETSTNALQKFKFIWAFKVCMIKVLSNLIWIGDKGLAFMITNFLQQVAKRTIFTAKMSGFHASNFAINRFHNYT